MFNTQLVITYQPNETGLPPDANPAWTPLQDLNRIKITEMKNANLLGRIEADSNVTTITFLNSAAANEYQDFLTEILIDLNQAVPTFQVLANV